MTTQTIIPSYPYVQFSDDVDIQAWFDAHNHCVHTYLDWINQTPLAIYTNENISGKLLDWVANGVYGIYRVPLANSRSQTRGEINTYTFNELPLNEGITSTVASYQNMSDDIFKRLITWNFYKGDGSQFSIPWLKNRIARFLYGINGFLSTNNISVKFTSTRTIMVTLYDVGGEEYIASQLSLLFSSGIPNLPYGYNVSISFAGK